MKTSITLKVRLKWPDVNDDYVIAYEDHLIGRMRLLPDASAPERAWEWSITVPMGLPEWARGEAASRDAAMKTFTAAWLRLLKQTPPARFERAWEFEQAARSRGIKRNIAADSA